MALFAVAVAALHTFRLARNEAAEQSLNESPAQVRRAEQTVAANADSSVHGIEERATFVAPRELRGGLEEHHVNRDVVTEGEVVLQS